MRDIKFTTRTPYRDGFGQTISISVYNYAESGETFLGKPLYEVVSSYTVYNKKYKEIK